MKSQLERAYKSLVINIFDRNRAKFSFETFWFSNKNDDIDSVLWKVLKENEYAYHMLINVCYIAIMQQPADK